MAVDGINKWTRFRKAGGIPWVSTRFSLSVENEQADAGRDGRIYLARSISPGMNGDRDFFSPVQLTTSRIRNLARLLYVMTVHTHPHTVDPMFLPLGNPMKSHKEV